jgi:hypothetical protein
MAISLSPWLLVSGFWWLVAGGWWLVAGGWLLVAGCWLLVSGCWLLVAGCWLLVAGCWFLVAGFWLLVSGFWLLVVGGWWLVAGCWLLVIGAPFDFFASELVLFWFPNKKRANVFRTREEQTMLGVIRAVAVLVCLFALVGTVQAQPPVSPRNSYERILVVLPIIGSGTAARRRAAQRRTS